PVRWGPRVGHDDWSAGEAPAADDRGSGGGRVPGAPPHERVDPPGALGTRDEAARAPTPAQREVDELEGVFHAEVGEDEGQEVGSLLLGRHRVQRGLAAFHAYALPCDGERDPPPILPPPQQRLGEL